MLLIGSHVGMSGKEMFLGSVKEALSYHANTFMVYTGAPQNTRRKELSELKIPEAKALMKENGIEQFIVHAPYIINLANSVNPSTFELAVEFLEKEITRSAGMGSRILVLHPGSHVGEGTETGIRKITEGLNQILTADTPVSIALETMAGKGSEIGSRFEELAEIYEKTVHSEKLRVCIDTCHMHDAGYDVIHDFDGILTAFDKLLGISQIAAVHLNDSKNPQGARKDRHANLGDGCIGFEALSYVAHHPALTDIPKILETPYIPQAENPDKKVPPYKEEIARLRQEKP
ncbi:MAG: deoxyribonuclease IV [Lachnospiraceae bacterium]|mgnify:CR=1 FL=1|jgi:deoxyribonuclease-4|nr:deoxyribonuclease IV [Lachnospiraceae bacterium]